MSYKVTFLPDNKQITVADGTTIMAAMAEAGVDLEGPCGGKGTCGKCRVYLAGEGSVLACRTVITRDMTVTVPQVEVALHRKGKLTVKLEDGLKVYSGVVKTALEVAKPSITEQKADAERFRKALNQPGLSLKYNAMKALPEVLRKNKQITAIIERNNVLAVEGGDTSNKLFGLAVDIGTTTLAAALVNLMTGETVAAATATNAQNIFGADVIARIEHVIQKPEGLEQLQKRVCQVINRLIAKLAEEVKITSDEIYLATVAGNTTMEHLFMGIDPRNLAPSPFIPVFTEPMAIEARDLGLNLCSHAPVYLLPNIAGYVGGDTMGVILATGLYHKQGTYIAVDIGTNGEIVLAVNGKLWACSTAAGPAFEGAHIRCGMRAANGAIERVAINNDVEIKVIGDAPAKGICGSGLMDAVAELVRVGVIETSGRMLNASEAAHLPKAIQNRLGQEEKGNYFVLAPGENGREPVILTQKDVRELQLAKAAIRAGIAILLNQAGLKHTDLNAILLAGAFGSYIDKQSALALGLLPPVDPDRIESVGNAAGSGAILALISKDLREHALEIAKEVKHIELSTRLDFQEYFVDALSF